MSGVLLTALRTFGEWRRCRALLAAAYPCEDQALVQALQLASDAHGVRPAPRLWMSTQVDAPQLVGPFRPVLLLPAGENALQGDALDLALTHELQHLQRRDLQWGLLPALAQHLFFFHPLLRLSVREYAQAREEAVDAAVVGQHAASRQAYGRLLLQLGWHRSRTWAWPVPHRMPPASSVACSRCSHAVPAPHPGDGVDGGRGTGGCGADAAGRCAGTAGTARATGGTQVVAPPPPKAPKAPYCTAIRRGRAGGPAAPAAPTAPPNPLTRPGPTMPMWPMSATPRAWPKTMKARRRCHLHHHLRSPGPGQVAPGGLRSG